MSKTPLLGIITRTKDRPLFLARVLRSVNTQTAKNFVHVIVNDAGDKNEVNNAVSRYSGNDYETKIINVRTNGRIEVATNAGIEAAGTKYIAVLDDDDTWHPELAERVIKHLEETDSKGVVVRTNKIVESLSSDGKSIKTLRTTEWMPEMRAVNLYRQFVDNQMTPVSFVYAKESYDKVGKYDENLEVMGDWDFGIRFLKQFDVDFLNPGYALANYHHRKFKAGAQGNTSYSGNDKKVHYANYLMNKFLREDLAEGKIGVGYIMSKTKYDQNFTVRMISKLLPAKVSKKFIERYRKM
jgi:glycosyltransferase involved in cell wall biosynthesis